MAQGGAGGESRSQPANVANVHRRGGVGGVEYSVLAVPLRPVEIARLAVVIGSLSTEGLRGTYFGWIIGPKGVSRVQRSEDLATSAQILCRGISKAFTDPSGQPRLAQESWRARRGPARQSNPSRICWRCSDSFLAPAEAKARVQLVEHPLALRRISWLWALPIPGIQDGAGVSPFPSSASWLNRSDSIYL
jgi:hypothetical protein